MVEVVLEQEKQIKSVLLWQLGLVSVSALIAGVIFSDFLSVLVGGLLVMLSTSHVHKSIYLSGGDKMLLLKAAGLRFVVFLVALALSVVLLDLQPIYLVAGMAASYIAMYVRSLLMILRQMKGDSLG